MRYYQEIDLKCTVEIDGHDKHEFIHTYTITHRQDGDIFKATVTDEYGNGVTMPSPPHDRVTLYKILRKWAHDDAERKTKAWIRANIDEDSENAI
jgi:hypothetical protein